jgi:hypothetical protein
MPGSNRDRAEIFDVDAISEPSSEIPTKRHWAECPTVSADVRT